MTIQTWPPEVSRKTQKKLITVQFYNRINIEQLYYIIIASDIHIPRLFLFSGL